MLVMSYLDLLRMNIVMFLQYYFSFLKRQNNIISFNEFWPAWPQLLCKTIAYTRR